MSGSNAPISNDKKRPVPSADDVEYLLENDVIDIDTLKQFTIPKKKSHNHDVFTRIEMTSPEARELIRVIHQSFKERDSVDCFVFSRPRLVNNTNLLDKFTDRKKQMKHNGYSEKELQEIYAFLYFSDDDKAVKACSEGIFTNNSDITCLGDPKMGVYLCKHADLISPKPLKNKMFGTILVVKVIKGRVKLMSDCVGGVILDPSPNFDCHVLKSSSMDISSSSLQHIFECTQLYLYEYMEDSELSQSPSQLIPYALLNFRYERSGRSLPLLATPSVKQNKVERKSILHGSSEKKKSQGNIVKETEPYANQKMVPLTLYDYQLWSGNVFASEVSMGFCLLNSSCIFIDGTFLGHDIYIREKVPLEYLKSTILKGLVSSLDGKKENFLDDQCIAIAALQPSFSNPTFNSFVEHLLQTSMVGYVALLDCTEIFLVPSEALKDCAPFCKDIEKQSLQCFFISKNAISSKIQGHLEQKLAMSFSRINPFFNVEKEQHGCHNLSDHPASPEPESSSAKVRDPRLRHKVKSTKLDPDCNNKQHSIIGSSRLLTLFEHLSDVQDKMNNEITHRSSLGQKPNYHYTGHAKPETSLSSQPFLPNPELKTIEPPLTETSGNMMSSSAIPIVSQNNVSSSFDDSTNQPKLPSFKIPETVYATAIADPKVNQLLEELKSKNIIGLGLSPLPEVSSSRSSDACPKLEGYEIQKRSGRADPRLEKMSKGGDCEIGFQNRGPCPQVYDPQAQPQPFSPDCPRVDGFYRAEVIQPQDERFNNVSQTHMRPYSPGDTGRHSPQFSDQRSRYGSFLPDPKTFQKKFIDTHHQRPHNPYPNKPESRANRSRFSRQLGSR